MTKKVLIIMDPIESINIKKAFGKTVTVGVSEMVFCATIEWE